MAGGEIHVSEPDVSIIEFSVRRPGDVNRHRYMSRGALRQIIGDVDPDLLDIHEEPFSLAGAQWLRAAAPQINTVMYTAQNIDKRLPPPFHSYEQRAYRRISGLYPCSRQAASVARGKGFDGLIDVVPLGYDPEVYRAGTQSLGDDELNLGLFGRLVPEKGVCDAVRVLAHLNRVRPTRLFIAGDGPERTRALELAATLGVVDRTEFAPRLPSGELAEVIRRTHVVLVPSVATPTWAEQFGRTIVEAQASGAVVAGYASGSIPEVAGEPGILVPERAVRELATNLEMQVTNEDEYEARRAAGLELSRSRTWTEVADQQADFYRRVLAHEVPTVARRAGVSRRSAARDEFGSPARTPVGDRPFALPMLRRGGAPAALVSWPIDLAARIRETRQP